MVSLGHRASYLIRLTFSEAQEAGAASTDDCAPGPDVGGEVGRYHREGRANASGADRRIDGRAHENEFCGDVGYQLEAAGVQGGRQRLVGQEERTLRHLR